MKRGAKEEISALEVGMDFRRLEYRREVFLRFWEFHLRYRAHPGCIYFVFPFLAEAGGWSLEQRLWFAYLNGNTQNPVTSWLIFRAFPDVHRLDELALAEWFNANYDRLAFDTDRRYQKKVFLDCVANYRALLAGGSQADFFENVTQGRVGSLGFHALWKFCHKHYIHFGRLSVFSYLEYLRVMGLDVDCDQLFLEDMAGSRSHRNGLCKVLGRDDLDWHSSNPGFDGRYSPALLGWLREEGAQLLVEGRARMASQPFARDVGYFTLESALCTYKSWHRPNRRYPNVYSDMMVDRIRAAEKAWGERLGVFWDARRAALPVELRLEDNPADPGVKPEKQNHYRLTGQVIGMNVDWPCFKNDLNDRILAAQSGGQ